MKFSGHSIKLYLINSIKSEKKGYMQNFKLSQLNHLNEATEIEVSKELTLENLLLN